MESKDRVIIPDRIFRLIADGDRQAFEELYRLTYRPMFAFCLSLTMNREDAEFTVFDRESADCFHWGEIMRGINSAIFF